MDLQVIPRRAIRQQVILWELIRLLADLAGASVEVVALAEVEVVAGDSGGKLKASVRLSYLKFFFNERSLLCQVEMEQALQVWAQ